jgi:hypothetical protein
MRACRYIGDLVVYHNKWSLERYDSVGIVVGGSDEKNLVFWWSVAKKRTTFEYHAPEALVVLVSAASVIKFNKELEQDEAKE